MSIYRAKLINAVLFFTKETKHTNTTKLMKLLNFFDFEHFNQTGYPSIGLEYFAFEKGPVPKKFWLEVKDATPPEDLDKLVKIITRQWGNNNYKELEFVARTGAKVDFSIFTEREKNILNSLAFIYKNATASEMSEISHQENLPWEKTIKEKGQNAEIDYLLALDEKSGITYKEAEETLDDYFETLKAFKIEPVK